MNLETARRLFVRPYIERKTSAHNIRQWRRSIRLLGDSWLLAKPQGRVQ